MSDLLRPELGARPWLPASDVTAGEVFHKYNIPLSGLIKQSGSTFLYTCMIGELEELNIWAYAHMTESELTALNELDDDDLARAIEDATRDRQLVMGLAFQAQLQAWLTVDSGADEPTELLSRFIEDLRPHLELLSRGVDEASRLVEADN